MRHALESRLAAGSRRRRRSVKRSEALGAEAGSRSEEKDEEEEDEEKEEEMARLLAMMMGVGPSRSSGGVGGGGGGRSGGPDLPRQDWDGRPPQPPSAAGADATGSGLFSAAPAPPLQTAPPSDAARTTSLEAEIALLKRRLAEAAAVQEAERATAAAAVAAAARAAASAASAAARALAQECPICLGEYGAGAPGGGHAVALVPCGHLLCDGCASSVAQCPTCRSPVESRVRVYS